MKGLAAEGWLARLLPLTTEMRDASASYIGSQRRAVNLTVKSGVLATALDEFPAWSRTKSEKA